MTNRTLHAPLLQTYKARRCSTVDDAPHQAVHNLILVRFSTTPTDDTVRISPVADTSKIAEATASRSRTEQLTKRGRYTKTDVEAAARSDAFPVPPSDDRPLT